MFDSRNRKLFGLAGLVALGGLVAGCSQFDTVGEEFQDVRVEGRNSDPAMIIEMPQGYSNVAFKCNGTTGIYVTRNDNGRAVAAVPNDSACGG